MTQAELVAMLRVGDVVTTTMDDTVTVGAIHPDQAYPGQWWVEPLGADEFTWSLPVGNILAVNGRCVPHPLG